MQTKSVLTLTLAALLSAPVAQADGVSPIEISPASPTAAGAARYAAGYILVKPKAGVTLEQFQDALNTVGGQDESVSEFSGVHRVRVDDGLEKAVADALSKHNYIEFATPDYLTEAQSVSSGTVPTETVGWHITDTRTDSAWNYSDGYGVTVAVLDSGFTLNHPDLAGKFLDGWNVAHNTADLSPSTEHGTPVAGVIGASRNGQGVTGIAPGALLLPVRVTVNGSSGAAISALTDGIYYAADHGAKVINISFHAAEDPALLAAVNYAKSHGVVTVIGAGNDNLSHNESPTSLQALVVAATLQDGNRAGFSGWGENVDLAAPGNLVPSTSDSSDFPYNEFSGTSLSAPVVSGVAALMMAENPSLTPDNVIAILQAQGLPLDDVCQQTNPDGSVSDVQCFPRARTVRAARAVMAAGGIPIDEILPTVAISGVANGASLSGAQVFHVEASDDVSVVRVEFYVNGQRIGEDVTAPYEFAQDMTQLGYGPATLEVRAYDGAGNMSAANVSVTVPVPVFDAMSPEGHLNVFALEPGKSAAKFFPARYNRITGALKRQAFWKVRGNVRFQVSATDDVGVTELSLYINGVQVATSNTGVITYEVNAYHGNGRTVPVSLVAKDAAGNLTVQEWSMKTRRKPRNLVLPEPAPW